MTTPTSQIKFELDTTMNEILEQCLNYSSKNPGINNSAISEIVQDATMLKSNISSMIKKSEAKKDREKIVESVHYIQMELKKNAEFLRGRIDNLSRLA